MLAKPPASFAAALVPNTGGGRLTATTTTAYLHAADGGKITQVMALGDRFAWQEILFFHADTSMNIGIGVPPGRVVSSIWRQSKKRVESCVNFSLLVYLMSP
jgi:hypothetical protein